MDDTKDKPEVINVLDVAFSLDTIEYNKLSEEKKLNFIYCLHDLCGQLMYELIMKEEKPIPEYKK